MALHCGGIGTRDFFRIGGTNHVEVWNDAQAADSFNGLVGGTVFANPNGVVREDVGDRKFGERREADGGAQVVSKDQEGGTAGAEDAVVSDPVADRAHGVFADAEPDIATGRICGAEVATAFDVIFGGAVEVCGTGDELRDGLRDGIDDGAAGGAGRSFITRFEFRDVAGKIGGDGIAGATFEFGGEFGVGGFPGSVGRVPCDAGGLSGFGEACEMCADFGRDVEGFGGEPETGAGGLRKFGTAFTVTSGSSLDFGDALGDGGFGNQDGGFAALVGFCGGEGLGDGLQVVPVKGDGIPAL